MNSHVDDLMRTRGTLLGRLRSSVRAERELAWEEFRVRYAPVIGGFAMRCGANRQDVEDIIQDVLTGFFTASGDFVYDRSKGRFRGYLKTCTVRVAVRRAGKRLQFREVSLEDLPEAAAVVEPLWNDVWEQQLVAEAISLLKQENQSGIAWLAFEEYVLRGRPAAEVAMELGTSVNNIHQTKTRMTKRLREVVRRLREEEETI